MPKISNFIDVWNNANTIYNSIKLDVTNTASANTSKLVNISVNNQSRYSIDKSGNMFAYGNITANRIIDD